MTVHAYVRRVARELSRFGPLAARPLAEIREHLLESRQNLIEAGATTAQAEAEAVRRFGNATEVAGQLAVVLAKERDIVERIVKLLALCNTFTAVWGLAATALLNPTGELLAATALVSIVTVAAALVCMRRQPDPGALVISGIALVAVGSAGILWALLGTRPALGPQIGLALLMTTYAVQGILTVGSGMRRATAEAAAEAS